MITGCHEGVPHTPLRGLAGILLAAAVVLAAGCGSASQLQATPEATPLPVDTYPETVIYRVYGDAYLADITMQVPTGTRQVANIELPAEETWLMPSGAFVYVSAQNNDESGSITCEIVVDGKVISRNTSEGGYTIASCQGAVP
jgi:hypothetical protein